MTDRLVDRLKADARHVHALLMQPLFSRESLLNSLFFVGVFMFASVIAQRWLGVLPASAISLVVACAAFVAVALATRGMKRRTSIVLLVGAVLGLLGAGLLPLEPGFAHPPSDENRGEDTEPVEARQHAREPG